MDGARAEFPDRGEVLGSTVPFVLRKAVPGKLAVEFVHHPVARYFGQNAERDADLLRSKLAFYETSQSIPEGRPPCRKQMVDAFPNRDLLQKREVRLLDLLIEALDGLQSLHAGPGSTPLTAYILVGNFAAGKTSWIKQHEPILSGTHLYFEGTNHTRQMRNLLARRLRELQLGMPIVCVWFRTPLDVCRVRNRHPDRICHETNVSDFRLIEVHEEFETIEHTEEFNQLIYV